jgi:hypothetical protein
MGGFIVISLPDICAAYEACATYRDRGESILAYRGNQSTAHFSTRYQRPGHFRFDAQDSTLGRLAISFDDHGARWRVDGDPRISEFEDREAALLELMRRPNFFLSASAQVLSLIPRLMFPAFSGSPRGRLGLVQDWSVGSEGVDGCIELKGRQDFVMKERDGLPGSVTTFSVSLIVERSRRLIQRFAADDVAVKYWPEFDTSIDVAEFAIGSLSGPLS